VAVQQDQQTRDPVGLTRQARALDVGRHIEECEYDSARAAAVMLPRNCTSRSRT